MHERVQIKPNALDLTEREKKHWVNQFTNTRLL